ncbi:MAG TPA: hypothetical protein VMB21_09985 [Candidatus Limnocylindria bacterium]|jgi:cell shape-determining protein MreD|nr:hypothetical protein [Candidatus Limnocylindria bacterium]
MSWVPTISLFFVAWLAVFAQTQFAPVARALGTVPGLVPALLVYAALTSHLAVVTGLAVFAALALDSLSASRLGVSLPSMFAVVFLIHARQQLILRDQLYAQFWLGLGAGLFVPLATLAVLSLGQVLPISGGATLWHLLLSALANGLMCPAFFRLFDALRHTFDYQPIAESSFRPDRQIKRGRM